MPAPSRPRPCLLPLSALALLAACASARGPAPVSSGDALEPAARPTVALVLGGGGARGFAEIGVLRALEQERIPIDLVVGTSVGSLVGALYADTGRVLDAEFLAIEVKEEDIFDYKALAILSGGLVEGEKLEEFLGTRLEHRQIEEFAVPFAAVATEVMTGRTVVFDRGPVASAVHASCAIPGVFVPVEVDGTTYVDGGVTDPVPADVARARGADVVIAVSIPAGLPSEPPENPVAVALQAVTIMSAEIARLRASEADVVITPDVAGVAYDDFSQKKRLIDAGEAAARAAMPAIREALAAAARTDGSGG